MPSLVARLTRKKQISFDKEVLPRVLSLLDLTLLGIGSTVGVGFYILAGQVARNVAGPAVTISFLVAGIASVFAGLCYAEFGSRVPKAGSAYVYSYVCVGEFTAFVIGWNLILEYVIGTASVARGFSAYIDELANNTISTALDNAMHMGSTTAQNYPDFLAFFIVLLLTVVLCIGVKESSSANNVFTMINLFVILYAIIACATQADPKNWKLTEDQVNVNSNESVCLEYKYYRTEELDENPWGTGGFSPYGLNGIMQGAATCFFGFVGFDVIATTGEEAMNPGRNIPMAIVVSLAFIFASYFGLSVVLTMALPYCMQDADAPLIQLFDSYQMMPSKWIVSIGAIFGFSASLFGVMFPMPRILYAMAEDGLIFRFMSRISKKFKTPIAATCVASALAAVMALMFTLDSLVNMMSIGTLMAYTIVAICVMILRFTDIHVNSNAAEYILLRYSPDVANEKSSKLPTPYGNYGGNTAADKFSLYDYLRQAFTLRRDDEKAICVGGHLTLSFSILCFLLALLVRIFGRALFQGDALALVLVSIFAILSVLNLFLLSRQPQSNNTLNFKVPLVPWLPGLSTFINLYLMCSLPAETWIRFSVWMVIGLSLYFCYGMKHSMEEKNRSAMNTNNTNGFACGNLHIPHIFIHPPTPRSSLKAGKLYQKRVSIDDHATVINDRLTDIQNRLNEDKIIDDNLQMEEQSYRQISEWPVASNQFAKESVRHDSEPDLFININGTNAGSSVTEPLPNAANRPKLNAGFLTKYQFDRKRSSHSGQSSTSEPSTPVMPRKKVLKRGRSFDVLTASNVGGCSKRYFITPIYLDDKSSTDESRRPSEISMASELQRKLFSLND